MKSLALLLAFLWLSKTFGHVSRQGKESVVWLSWALPVDMGVKVDLHGKDEGRRSNGQTDRQTYATKYIISLLR